MPILQPLDPSTVPGEIPGKRNRPHVRVLIAGNAPANEFDLRRLIAADPDLLGVGRAAAAHETLHQAQDLQPDVVVLDGSLSHDVVLLARALTALDRPPAVVVRSASPEPLMAIAAIVAGVRGIVSRGDPDGAICDAIRWVARKRRWLPDIPLWAVSQAGSHLERNDLPILLMLLRGTPLPDIAANLKITAASLDGRRSAMLLDVLGQPALGGSRFDWRAGESAPAASEPHTRSAIAA